MSTLGLVSVSVHRQSWPSAPRLGTITSFAVQREVDVKTDVQLEGSASASALFLPALEVVLLHAGLEGVLHGLEEVVEVL
jgi:hypothetical protein